MKKKTPQKKQERNDSWMNAITSVGTNNDKRQYAQVFWDQRSPEFYEQLYTGDEISSRIVNVVPEESLREFVEWTGYEKDIVKEVDKRCLDLDVKGALERAWKWGRAYGGGVVYVVTDTNDPASPLQLGERVIGLRDLSRYDLRILTTDVETDFGAQNWGHPNIYYLTVQMGSSFKGYPIHWTRMIRFDGYLVPRRTFIRNNYWHDSILNRLYNAIRNYQTSNDSAATILQDFNVGVYKMKNLANLISAGKTNIIKSRIEMLNFSKSTIRAMILDSDDEEFVDLSRSVDGLAELLTKQANRLVAATDIPHTKLLGESPDGSSATGNSTNQQWFNHIRSEQENYLRAKLNRLKQIIFYDMDDLDFKFKPLYQLSELEQADMRLKVAQSDQIYLSTGVIDPTEVAQSRFGGDKYSIETQLDEEARELGLIAPGSNELESEQGEEEELKPKTPTAKKDSEAQAMPASLQPFVSKRKGAIESGNNGEEYNFRNEQVVAKDKVKAFISQTMSEPMRDPRTDPKIKAGGVPNNQRQIMPTRGSGVIAPSGGGFKTDVGVEPTMKEFYKGTLKSGSGKKITNPKQAAAIGYSEQKDGIRGSMVATMPENESPAVPGRVMPPLVKGDNSK